MPKKTSNCTNCRLVIDGSGSELDKLFSVMVDQRRRYVLYYLQEAAGDAVECEKLIQEVANWETEPGDEPTDDHREEVEIALQHHHLPTLEDYGVIEYDQRSGMVRYRSDLSKQKWVEEAKTKELDEL